MGFYLQRELRGAWLLKPSVKYALQAYLTEGFNNHSPQREASFANKKTIDKANVIDTLEIARSKYPGSQNSLDALCKRYNIDNSRREKHSALIDCNLLKEVYVNLLDQKTPKLNLERSGNVDLKFDYKTKSKKNILRKIVKLNDDELKNHKKYLQSQLPKNNYN